VLSKFGGYGYASQIQVLFKSAEFFPLILQQKLTTLDFVSFCGGSLGLFLGFSALSVVELVYFFSMRLFFRMRTRNRVQSFKRIDEAKKKTKNGNYFVEVMRSSSIHGCNHAASGDYHRVEKYEDDSYNLRFLYSYLLCSLYWLLTVIVVISFCCSTTFRIFKNYQNAPIIMSFDDVVDTSKNVRIIPLFLCCSLLCFFSCRSPPSHSTMRYSCTTHTD
jgi:hypothetical protein